MEDARETIRSTVEELEASNEELKSSNEEMMSMNEELQSANEELTTTNEELNNKIAEIRDINSDLANFIRATRIATVFLDAEMNLRSFTPEAQRIFRFVPRDRGRKLDDLGADLDVAALLDVCRDVSQNGEIITREFSTKKGDVTYQVRIVPYKEGETETGGVVFTLVDVTEFKELAAEAAVESARASQTLAEVEAMYRISPQAMGLISPEGRYLRVNEKLAQINALPAEEHAGLLMSEVVPDLEEQVMAPINEVVSSGKPIEGRRVRGRTQLDDGFHVWDCDWYPVVDGGELIGVGVNVRDITQQEQMAFELRRVMQELQHRVKNMLANVLALVSRARKDATSDREVIDGLANRIRALAQTHKLLTQSNWTSAELHSILGPELVDVYGADRVKLRGPRLKINARSALSLGMAIHELATNAAKYGAFSVPNGRVDLSWIRQDDGSDDSIIFTWRERGGPEPDASAKSGFGSQLIRSTIEGSLNGKVDIILEPTGLVCVMTLAADQITEIPDDTIFDIFDT